MSRIINAFRQGKAFIGFLTAGDPSMEKSEEYILAMAEAGVDLIEIGIPFSDPIAEGKVIEAANVRALAGGATIDKIFSLVENVRKKTEIPLVFLTYLNPVYNYGYEEFFGMCQKKGIDGIIVPDLPFEEKDEITGYTEKYNVDLISLIAPTSEQRITQIAKKATGFIYVVSSLGVTGMRTEIQTDLSSIIKSIRSVSDVPIAVGFGINTPKQAEKISMIADGIIVGSAIVKIIEQHGDQAKEPLIEYIKSIKAAIA